MDKLKKLWDIFILLIENKFYGSVVIKFENGIIVNIKKEESIKL